METSLNFSSWVEDLQYDWTPYIADKRAYALQRNGYLYHQGSSIDSIYVIKSGRVRLCVTSPAGDEKTILIVGKNCVVGEIGLFDSNNHVTSAITSSETTVYIFQVKEFNYILETTPDVMRYVLSNLSRKFQILSSQSLDLSYSSAQYRVVKSLTELAKTYGRLRGDAVIIDIRFTQQEMANLAGTTRVTVSQVFRSLESAGILERETGFVVITDLPGLSGMLRDPKSSHVHPTR